MLPLAGPVPYTPKARVIYQALEVAIKPKQRNIVTAEDSPGPYWRAVRWATAPCFSITNLKKVCCMLETHLSCAACMWRPS